MTPIALTAAMAEDVAPMVVLDGPQWALKPSDVPLATSGDATKIEAEQLVKMKSSEVDYDDLDDDMISKLMTNLTGNFFLTENKDYTLQLNNGKLAIRRSDGVLCQGEEGPCEVFMPDRIWKEMEPYMEPELSAMDETIMAVLKPYIPEWERFMIEALNVVSVVIDDNGNEPMITIVVENDDDSLIEMNIKMMKKADEDTLHKAPRVGPLKPQTMDISADEDSATMDLAPVPSTMDLPPVPTTMDLPPKTLTPKDSAAKGRVDKVNEAMMMEVVPDVSAD